jgi:hypothetical protein
MKFNTLCFYWQLILNSRYPETTLFVIPEGLTQILQLAADARR